MVVLPQRYDLDTKIVIPSTTTHDRLRITCESQRHLGLNLLGIISSILNHYPPVHLLVLRITLVLYLTAGRRRGPF